MDDGSQLVQLNSDKRLLIWPGTTCHCHCCLLPVQVKEMSHIAPAPMNVRVWHAPEYTDRMNTRANLVPGLHCVWKHLKILVSS